MSPDMRAVLVSMVAVLAVFSPAIITAVWFVATR